MLGKHRFLEHSQSYGMLFLVVYIFINNTINATSNIMEGKREDVLPFELWEPFVWEYTSAISTLMLVPAVIFLLARLPFNLDQIRRSLGIYLTASIVFSALHVLTMVWLRKMMYWVQDGHYDFGAVGYEFLYEYRKDLWGFIFLIAVIKGYQYLIAQLKGEAHLLAQAEETAQPQFERLLVKKLGKEFIINVADIEWIESAGNYVNLHIGKRIYPLRSTFTKLCQQLESHGFCRIHRSYGVRLNAIDSITPLGNGDSEIALINGKTLNLSRRYKEQFKGELKVVL